MGTGPLLPLKKTRKHVLPAVGWSRVAPLAPSWPPSEAAIRRAACCCWRGELALLPPVSSSCPSRPAGEEALGPRQSRPNPLSQQGNNGLDGLGAGWVEGQPLCLQAPTSSVDRLLGGLLPLASPTLSCFPPCWAHCLPRQGQGKQRPQEMSLGCCWGSAALGGRELGEGSREGLPHCAGCILPGAVANESWVSFSASTLRTVSSHLGVFGPSIGPATEQIAEIIC